MLLSLLFCLDLVVVVVILLFYLETKHKKRCLKDMLEVVLFWSLCLCWFRMYSCCLLLVCCCFRRKTFLILLGFLVVVLLTGCVCQSKMSAVVFSTLSFGGL